jgi:hypothetical protein
MPKADCDSSGNTMKIISYVAAGLACGLALSAEAAWAQGMGLDGLHAQARVGNKICMIDHFHNGASSGKASRKAAEAEAIAAWAGFTAWEYSGAWGSWRLSESKSMNCGQSGGSWGCTIESRPCRPAGGRAPRSRRR